MLLVDTLFIKTLGVYHFIIFRPKKWFEQCDSIENKWKKIWYAFFIMHFFSVLDDFSLCIFFYNKEKKRTRKVMHKRENIRRQIFEGKLSVSPHFLHHYQDNNEAGMLLVGKLSLKTLGVYVFIIFWPKK